MPKGPAFFQAINHSPRLSGVVPHLQDAQDKRRIHADATLEPIFGGKTSVSMFELAKLVSQHVQ
jgi:SWIB/MDM2 domain